MKCCSNCASPVVKRVPPGDSLARWVCDACGEIHYQNPKLVVGAVPEWEGRLLLCRRAIEPRYGYWTLPAGFMENDETAGQAALRETLEEAGARVSRYLRAQLLINAIFAITVGTGLLIVGLPNAALCGLVAGVLRFIPILGPWLAAAIPAALAVAVFDNWYHLVVVISLSSSHKARAIRWSAARAVFKASR